MKTITSKEALLKKLKKNNLLFFNNKFYLSDFHRTKVGNVLSNKLIQERILEPAHAMKAWFESEFQIRKPVGEHNGVNIFYDHKRQQFFFKVKKGGYDLDTFQDCCKKLDYLKNLGEKLTA